MFTRHHQVPPTPPQLVEGRSTQYWTHLRAMWSIPALIWAVPLLLVILLAPGSTVMWIVLWIWVGLGGTWMVPAVVAMLRLPGLQRKENSAGYTTATYPRPGPDLWILDDKTGAVKRMPNDADMTRAQAQQYKLTGRRYTDEELMSGVRGKPGWYPDYRHGYVLTWWDGQQWTDHKA